MSDIPQDPDRIPTRTVLVVTGATVLAIALSAAVVVGMVRWADAPLGAPGRAGAPRQVSAVESHLFFGETDAERQLREARQRLASFGWVDRAAGRVHVPAELAIRLYLEREARK